MKMNCWDTDLEDQTRRDLEDLERYHHNTVDHPGYYGGKDNPYEAIKVIEAHNLNFALGSVIKYVLRAGKKSDSALKDLQKAQWYIQREIQNLGER